RNANNPGRGVRSVVISIVLLGVGATTVFAQLQSSLNRISQVGANPHESVVWGFIRERLLSLAMVAGIRFLLLVSLLVNAGLSAPGESSPTRLGTGPQLLQTVNLMVSLVIVTLRFAVMFKVLPDAPVAWGAVCFGAVASPFLFPLGKDVIGFSLAR